MVDGVDERKIVGAIADLKVCGSDGAFTILGAIVGNGMTALVPPM